MTIKAIISNFSNSGRITYMNDVETIESIINILKQLRIRTTRFADFSSLTWNGFYAKKHPDVKEKGKTVDMLDLWADRIVRFERRFYIQGVK